MELTKRIQDAAAGIRHRCDRTPRVGIILGTGLGEFARRVSDAVEISYDEVPHFSESTVESHAGQLVLGSVEGIEVVLFEGRFHLYEGYTPEQVTFPVRVARALGADTLIVTNACGGMNPVYRKGDLVLIEDHINLMGVNPLVGPNDDSLGPRFPDMCAPYDRALLDLAGSVALSQGVRAHEGVFVAVTGPCLETRAEYRFLRGIGADTVGMSTVPEVIVAVHGGMRVLGVSVVTDVCLPDALEPVDVSEIIAVAQEAGPRLESVLAGVLGRFGEAG